MTLNKAQAAAIQEAAQRLSYLVGSCPEGHRPLDPSCPFCRDGIAQNAADAHCNRYGHTPAVYDPVIVGAVARCTGCGRSIALLRRGQNDA